MKILTSISEVENIPDFSQLEIPVAITAPLMTSDRVLIGLYGPETGHACIDLYHTGISMISRASSMSHKRFD